jgi:hypothetical protein
VAREFPRVAAVERFNSEGDKTMTKRFWPLAAVPVLICAGAALAQHPVLDSVADKVVQKYRTSTCEQLWQERQQGRNKPKPEAEQRLVKLLHEDAAMRAEFFNRISAPVVTKMFECGMIP